MDLKLILRVFLVVGGTVTAAILHVKQDEWAFWRQLKDDASKSASEAIRNSVDRNKSN